MIKTFENSKGILFIFIPFFLIIGPAIADISVSLIGFLFILISILKKDYTYLNLFKKKNRASLFERILSQIFMIFDRPGAEGGLFIFIGKKK